jgi:hypothetical protein
LKKC